MKRIRIYFSCLILLSMVGCGGIRTIDRDGLKARNTKTFNLGLVKVAGRTPFTDKIESKISALKKLNVDQIAASVSEEFGIHINTQVDRSIRIVKESGKEQPPKRGAGVSIDLSPYVFSASNPYFGSLSYKQSNWPLADDYLEDNVGDWVFIEYRIQEPGFMQFSFKLQYRLTVKSDGLTLLDVPGEVTSVPMIPLDFLSPSLWEALIENAKSVDGIIKKDIKEMGVKGS